MLLGVGGLKAGATAAFLASSPPFFRFYLPFFVISAANEAHERHGQAPGELQTSQKPPGVQLKVGKENVSRGGAGE